MKKQLKTNKYLYKKIYMKNKKINSIITESIKNVINEKLNNIDPQMIDSGNYNYSLDDYRKAKSARNKQFPKGFYVCVETDYGYGVKFNIGTEKDAKMVAMSSEAYAMGPYFTQKEALFALNKIKREYSNENQFSESYKHNSKVIKETNQMKNAGLNNMFSNIEKAQRHIKAAMNCFKKVGQYDELRGNSNSYYAEIMGSLAKANSVMEKYYWETSEGDEYGVYDGKTADDFKVTQGIKNR